MAHVGWHFESGEHEAGAGGGGCQDPRHQPLRAGRWEDQPPQLHGAPTPAALLREGLIFRRPLEMDDVFPMHAWAPVWEIKTCHAGVVDYAVRPLDLLGFLPARVAIQSPASMASMTFLCTLTVVHGQSLSRKRCVQKNQQSLRQP